MLESQFYTNIILRALVGLIVFKTVVKFAKHNPVDENAKAGILQKVFGGVFGLLALSSLFVFFTGLSRVVSPTEIIEIFPPNGIVYSPEINLAWGYATVQQNSVLTTVSIFFLFLSLTGYILFFKKSPTGKGKKALKVLFIALILIIYNGCIDFHYFQWPEFLAIGLLGIFLSIASYRIKKKRGDKKKEDTATNEEVSDTGKESEPVMEEKAEIETADEEVISVETVVEGMVAEAPGESANDLTAEPVVEDKTEAAEPEPILDETMFCSYCGKKIEIDSKFCKYCGEKL